MISKLMLPLCENFSNSTLICFLEMHIIEKLWDANVTKASPEFSTDFWK